MEASSSRPNFVHRNPPPDYSELNMPPPNLPSLPPEILRLIACYLPLDAIHTLLLSNPRCFRGLHADTTGSLSFAPWRRRFFVYHRAYIRTLRKTQDWAVDVRIQGQPNIVASGQVRTKTALEQELEELSRDMARDLGLMPVLASEVCVDRRAILPISRGEGDSAGSPSDPPPPIPLPEINLNMIFHALEHLFETELEHLRLQKLLCPLSEIIGILSRDYLQIDLIQKLTPVPLLPTSPRSETALVYKILTAYLFYTSLTPNDILGVLSDALSAQGQDMHTVKANQGDQEMALVEYFHFLQLFLIMYEYDETLRPRSIIEKDILSHQARRILAGRLDVWIRGYFRPERPLPRSLASSTPSVGYNAAQSPSPVSRRFGKTTSVGYGVPLSGLKHRTASYRTSSWTASRSSDPSSSPISCSPAGGQENAPCPSLTKEQEQIVRTDICPGDLMKVRAYAGTGKTMSLTEYAKARPDIRFLYVAFNKGNQQDAEKRFPHKNVDCKTMHSIALRVLHVFAPRIKDSLPDPGKTINDRRSWDGRTPTMEISFSAKHVIEMLGLANNAKITSALVDPAAHSSPRAKKSQRGGKLFPTANAVATVVKKILEKYWSSKDLKLSRRCMPLAMIEKLGLRGEVLLKWAVELWERMVTAKARYISHDGYLKLLHLDGMQKEPGGAGVGGFGADRMNGIEGTLVRGNGDREAFSQYDVIMLDEAQDSTPSMAEVILRQRPWMRLIVVGDPYQKIYGFRGATNEFFDDVAHPPTHSFRLTHSFRFGDEIAGVANVLLRALRENVGVNGVRKGDSVKRGLPRRLESPLSPNKDVEVLKPGEVGEGGSGKYTMIFRKNITLVRYAIGYCISHFHLQHRIALYTARNFSKSNLFTLLRTAYNLFHKGASTKVGILAGYSSWQELKDHVEAENSEDGAGGTDSPGLGLVVGLEGLIADEDFLRTIATCEQMVVDKEDEANVDVILITTHQAKGQEWDRVVVAGDFKPSYSLRGILGKTKYWQEEMFMMYVAVTRAKKELIVGEGVAAWLAGEMGAYRIYISPVQGEGRCPVCHGRPRAIPGEGGEEEEVHPRRKGVIMGYESLLPVGSFGMKIMEPTAKSRRPFCGKKDVLVCDLCVQQWFRADRVGTDPELVAVSLPLTRMLDRAGNLVTRPSIGPLSERASFSAVYQQASTAESQMVEGWVENRTVLSVIVALEEKRAEEERAEEERAADRAFAWCPGGVESEEGEISDGEQEMWSDAWDAMVPGD